MDVGGSLAGGQGRGYFLQCFFVYPEGHDKMTCGREKKDITAAITDTSSVYTDQFMVILYGFMSKFLCSSPADDVGKGK